jgi:hypothetical protein
MKVIILGSGISGLFAAWACEQSGVNRNFIEIFSNDVKKPKAFGFQYLHDPCGIELGSHVLNEEILQKHVPIDACSSLYSLKLYGSMNVYNSVTKLSSHSATSVIWNMNEAIDFLWNRYFHRINDMTIHDANELIELSKKYDLVFSTIPLDKLYHNLSFQYRQSYVIVLSTSNSKNSVFYNVSPESHIYRSGTIFGEFFIESNVRLTYCESSIEVKKVITKTSGINLPNNVHLIGRYGSWDKSVMAHDVYDTVRSVCCEERALGHTS